MVNNDETKLKVGFGVWVCLCVLASLWMISKFLKGKQQFHTNLHVVEDSLRKMQERLEQEERRKSMGCLDINSLEELTRHFNNVSEKEEQCQQEDEGEGKKLIPENAVGELEAVNEDESVEDKKNL